jgi:TonB family protein
MSLCSEIAVAAFISCFTLAAQQQMSPPANPLLDAEQIAQLQQQVRSNPEDLQAREKLLLFYLMSQQGPQFVEQVLWMVQNHPDSRAAGMSRSVRADQNSFTTPADYALVKAAWDAALTANSDDAQTNYNAGLFFQSSDASRAVQLFAQAHRLNPDDQTFVQAEADMYRRAIKPDSQDLKGIAEFTPDQASALKASLKNSSDAALLGTIGERLGRNVLPPQACPEPCQPGNEELKNFAWGLLERAIALQPDNQRWQRALDLSKRIASGQAAPLAPGSGFRIGGQVMEANLLMKVDPVYPPLARAARVQGNVEFTVTVDESGHVANLQLVRGHPLLVNAAKEAVLQWTYRPTLLNGKPVQVITDVMVNFNLSPQEDGSTQQQPPKH